MQTMNQDTLIIIPAFNEEKTIGDVVKDLQNGGFRSILVVDDGSTDNTAKILREKYKEGIKILKGNGDLWWTGGMNLGLQSWIWSGLEDWISICFRSQL